MGTLYYLILLVTISAPWVKAQLQVSVVTPNTFRIDADETLGIAITNSPGVVRSIDVTLKDQLTKKIIIPTQTVRVSEGKPEIIHLRIRPKDITPEQEKNPHIFVILSLRESTGQFSKEVSIPVTKYSGYVFVQTDKPLYLPNQNVFIRIFYMNEKMIPVAEDISLEIKNPNGSRVYYQENMRTDPSGITETNFKFPTSPVFGNWTVSAHYGFKKVARTTVRFEVKNYVLPTFSVKIRSQKIILKTDQHIRGSVKAEYVYGKPVDGTVSFKFAVKRPSGVLLPLGSYKHLKLDKGECHYNIRRKDFDTRKIGWFPNIDKSMLVVEAEVIEKATGKKESAIDDSSIFTTSPYVIDLSRSLKEFKPGVPYQIQVDVRYVNNLPLTERVPVRVTGFAKKAGNAKVELPKKDDLSTDLNGRVMFQFDTEQSFNELELRVQTVDEGVGDNQASATVTVTRYQTPVANTYIWIAAPQEGTLFQVGKTFQTQVTVYPQDNMKLLYMVVSRGMVLVLNETQTQGSAVVRTIQFPVTADMSPNFRLIAYFVKNGKIISDSMQFDVEKSCKYNNGNEFSVTSEEQIYSPGNDVTFKIKGEPDSIVGIGAVDEALYLLNRRDLLTKEKVFKEMERHDLGMGAGGGTTPANVFKNAGILMLSNSGIDEHGRKEGIVQKNDRKKRSAAGKHWQLNSTMYMTPQEKVAQYEGETAKCCRLAQFKAPVGMDCSSRASKIYEMLGEKYNCSYAFLDCCQEFEKYNAAKTGRVGKPVANGEKIGDDLHELIELIEEDVLKNIRRYFPETWFFSTFKIGDNKECKGEKGECELRYTSPHSITTWIVQAIAVSKTNGMCVAQSTKVTVFRDMFVQLDLPATAVRGEQIEVLATVFNYKKKDLTVNVYMFGTEGVCMGAGPGERTPSRKLLVPQNGAASVSFPVMPLEVSNYPLRVAALSWDSSDAVEKKLRVVPEGVPTEKTISLSLDPSGIYSRRRRRDANLDGSIREVYDEVLNKQLITVDLDLPKNYVPGTEQCFINVVGDPVGQSVNTTLSGLEGRFVRLPAGCGEQTMITLGPLVYTMFYLKKTNQLSSAIEKTGHQHMWQGYAHQQKYRKADGSYAVWANHASSTWLTAFVVKVFCQASLFIEIPPANINSAIEWLIKRQQATGAFAENHRVYHTEMTGGIQGDVTLTAYVLISILECNNYDSATKRIAVNRAVTYLEQNIPFVKRPYTVAILAYALSLTKSTKRLDANQKLKAIAMFNPERFTRFWNWDASEFGTGPKPWVYQHQPGAVAVETTSYALLAQLAYDDLDYAHPIVNWLNQQRSSSGSFKSTQDTVIALQALAEYNIKSKVPALDMLCNISSSASATAKTSIRLRRDNPHAIQEVEVPAAGRVYLDVTGKGMGTMSLTMKFNTEQDADEKCKYDLTVTAEESDAIIREEPVIRPEVDEYDFMPQVLVRQIVHPDAQKEDFGYDVDEDKQDRNRAGQKEIKEGSRHVIKLTICVKYLEKKASGMSILDIGLYTGYSALTEDLSKLIRDDKLKASQFEVSDRSVVLYLDEVPFDKPRCFSFRTVREIIVGKVQPTSVKVYNYYDPDKSCTKFYGPNKESVMMKKICEGRECVCVEGICSSCTPFADLRKVANDQTRRSELVNIICSRGYDFFWNGTLKGIREEGSFKYYDFEVTDVLKEGVEKKEELEGETITFIGRGACECPMMNVGNIYMIISKDGFLYKTEDGDMKFKYLFDQTSKIYHSRPLKEIRDQQGQKLQKTFNTLYMRFKGGTRCTH